MCQEGDHGQKKNSLTWTQLVDSGYHLDSIGLPWKEILVLQFLVANVTIATREFLGDGFASHAPLCLSGQHGRGRRLPQPAGEPIRRDDQEYQPIPVSD